MTSPVTPVSLGGDGITAAQSTHVGLLVLPQPLVPTTMNAVDTRMMPYHESTLICMTLIQSLRIAQKQCHVPSLATRIGESSNKARSHQLQPPIKGVQRSVSRSDHLQYAFQWNYRKQLNNCSNSCREAIELLDRKLLVNCSRHRQLQSNKQGESMNETWCIHWFCIQWSLLLIWQEWQQHTKPWSRLCKRIWQWN